LISRGIPANVMVVRSRRTEEFMNKHAVFTRWLMVALLWPAARLGAEELMVFAAASLTDALKEIRSVYTPPEPVAIMFNFDGSSTLARQIAEGAPADVFISADEAKMDGLAERGLVVAATRRSILSNVLVAVTHRDSGIMAATPHALAGPDIRRLALADPASVPAGVYAKAYLTAQGVWPQIEDKVVGLANVRSVLAAVEAGNAEAGFVYKTDAAMSASVRILFVVPPEDSPSITYPVAVLTASRQPDAAARFVNFLQSAEASAIFRRYGFEPLPQ
jgi:molybdate transport system substrate-binding protein